MSFGAVIVLVVLIVAVAVLIMQHNDNRKDRETGGNSERERQLAAERDSAEAELADLRERVKVLERITTDKHRGDKLSEEISKLRKD